MWLIKYRTGCLLLQREPNSLIITSHGTGMGCKGRYVGTERTDCTARWRISQTVQQGGGIKGKKPKKELSPHTTAALSLHRSALAPRTLSQRHPEGISEQTRGSACAALQLRQSQSEGWSSSPNFKRDTESLRSGNTPAKKELRLGNAANKAVRDVRSVGYSTAPGEGLLADGGDGALLRAVCQPGRGRCGVQRCRVDGKSQA